MGARHDEHVKWGRPALGTPGGVVTWSATALTDAFSRIDVRIEAPEFLALVRRAFDAWDDVLDLELREVGPFARADIVIGGAFLDGPDGTLGVARTEFIGHRLLRAAVRMDVEEDWTTDPDFVPRRFADPVNWYAVVAHEVGHALGLPHLADRSSLMHATSLRATDLTLTDVREAVRLYGPEPGVAGPGDQILASDGGAHRLRGGAGRDSLHGFGGDDTLEGGSGRDRLVGGTGDDALLGGGGRDVLRGGTGADRLDGGAGGDRLIGGPGADVFVLDRGRDVATDFRQGVDAVEVASGPARFEGLRIEQGGRGALVRTGDATLVLVGVEAADLSADDFLFA